MSRAEHRRRRRQRAARRDRRADRASRRPGAADIGMANVPLGQLHDTARAGPAGPAGRGVRLRARAAAIEPGPRRRLRRPAHPGGSRGRRAGRRRRQSGDPARRRRGARRAAGPGGPARRHGRAAAGRELGRAGVLTDRERARPVRRSRSWTCRSRRRWTRRCSGCSTRPARPACRPGQYLAISLSAADEYIDVPTATLREQFVPALARLFPAAARTEITDFFVTRERRATFRQAPGCAGLRPGTATPAPGLVLAGAWTDTGWPDTMEGAVRSGHNAADQLIRELTAADRATTAVTPEPAGRGAR